jgi:arsenate reductase (thioredoxin)
MFPFITSQLNQFVANFESIPESRKIILQKLSNYIQQQIAKNETAQLVYICTHNSRRSHFGQVAAALAAAYYNIKNVHAFSGGTETTALHNNAILAMHNFGLRISKISENDNAHYEVTFGEQQKILCFSKTYNHISNPQKNFAAIMTCSDAEENCPFIPNIALRISTTYDDPKIADNTEQQNEVYYARLQQITTETLYAFSLVKTNLP